MGKLSYEALRAGLARQRFVVVGRAGMDLFTDAGRVIEDGGSFGVDVGGSSANIAVGICKLGGQSALVTRVSDDAIGSFARARLGHYGVETQYVGIVGGEYRTSMAIYESVIEGHRNVLYRNGAADFQMDMQDVAAVDYADFGALITAGTVFAAEPSRAAAFDAFDRAGAAGVPRIFDVDYRPYSWPSPQVASDVLSRAAAQCEVIVGNDEEFGFMAGDYEQGLEKARALSREGAAIVVYKMGPAGAITFAEGREIRTGIYPVEALKPTGAGDSFMAGLVMGLGQGRDLEEAILRGSACASVTVSKPGCSPAMATADELDAFLATHPGPTPVDAALSTGS